MFLCRWKARPLQTPYAFSDFCVYFLSHSSLTRHDQQKPRKQRPLMQWELDELERRKRAEEQARERQEREERKKRFIQATQVLRQVSPVKQMRPPLLAPIGSPALAAIAAASQPGSPLVAQASSPVTPLAVEGGGEVVAGTPVAAAATLSAGGSPERRRRPSPGVKRTTRPLLPPLRFELIRLLWVFGVAEVVAAAAQAAPELAPELQRHLEIQEAFAAKRREAAERRHRLMVRHSRFTVRSGSTD
jgi:hypothetical protein